MKYLNIINYQNNKQAQSNFFEFLKKYVMNGYWDKIFFQGIGLKLHTMGK